MILGCEVLFPDTLFFENGLPSMLVQNDKDFALSIWNDDKPLPPINDLLAKLEKTIRARKDRKTPFWAEK